jgi:DNA-binding transcriptional LysR family regulator
MNWDDLRVFLALCRDGTFAAAARSLSVNPTTVARRLTSLEEAVGSHLFTRTRDGLVPTAAAEEIREAVELVERQLKSVERSIGGGDARLAGKVRLNLTQNLATNFLIDRLGDFRAQHPTIQLELNTSDALVDLTLGDADLVIRHRSPNAGPGVETSGHIEILARRVGSIGFAVFAAQDYLERNGRPDDIEDLAGHDAVLPRNDAIHVPGVKWSLRVAGQLRAALRSDSIAAMQAACQAGFGLCVLPCFPSAYRAKLMRVSDNVDLRDTWLLMPGDLKRIARVRALWDYLVTLFDEWNPMLSGETTPPELDARTG